MHLRNFVKQTLGNRLKHVMNFTRHVQCRIKIGKVFFLRKGMCSRDLHVTVTTISVVKIKHFHFYAKADSMCEYCNELCDQYHLTQCTVRKVSLQEAATIFKKY